MIIFPIIWKILSEKLANFCMISREISKYTQIRQEDFTEAEVNCNFVKCMNFP